MLPLLDTCFRACFSLALFFDPEDWCNTLLETSVDFQRTAGHYIAEDGTLNIRMNLQNAGICRRASDEGLTCRDASPFEKLGQVASPL
jgi:hypothetical protein